MPGQTMCAECVMVGDLIASMEGRTIARPNPPHPRAGRHGRRASMEGRTIARPNVVSMTHTTPTTWTLQWRAGQLPGQTHRDPLSFILSVGASMEGRTPSPSPATAPPPLQWRAGQLPGQTRSRSHCHDHLEEASMEGRTIARPNEHSVCGLLLPGLASMEGRTIARPNGRGQRSRPRARRQLQWRAGQLPGQTALLIEQQVAGRVASMEGRTIARPNHMAGGWAYGRPVASMEGRTIARPNAARTRPCR